MNDQPVITANKEGWQTSQDFELAFWKNDWPFRNLPLPELREARHADAVWLLKQFGIEQVEGTREFNGLRGKVLEVGCGPIGLFELCEGVEITAQDTLMDAYARELPYSTLGKRGASNYTGKDVSEFNEKFDAVICSNVLDHTADWVEFLENMAKLCNDGGKMIIFTESRGAPVLGHTQIFTGDQVARVLTALGAKNIPVRQILAVPPGGHCDYRNFIMAEF